MTSKSLMFAYYTHTFAATVQGYYWRLNACLNSEIPACATHLLIYAIEKAQPFIQSSGAGFFGLAPTEDGLLDQMLKKEMIAKMQFGVHTHMFNSTEDPSQIRFGGYNEDLFKEGHRQTWINTLSSDTWMFEFIDGGFKTHKLFSERQKVLIDPGYPFI